MRLKDYIRASLSHPPHVTMQKAVRLARRRVSAFATRQGDFVRPTYSRKLPFSTRQLERILTAPALESLFPHAESIRSLSALALEHRFDLLGSGWVQVHHNLKCSGLDTFLYYMGAPVEPDPEGIWLKDRINRANLNSSMVIWKAIQPQYTPIDWHRDFKSGYRWRENTWFMEVPFAHEPGVDIKVPWELARMQHLIQLAYAYGLAKAKQHGFQPAARYWMEFQNQVLDFIATNPPRFGVNWRCPMDVGIRLANWLVSYDLFRAQGATAGEQFDSIFVTSIYDHGRHILQNLEWNPSLRSNHYLGDIAGLLFAAAYLPRSRETDTWLALAAQELVYEMQSQFQPDGSNFEVSTSYHRLSGEMMLFATALLLGLPEDKLAALKDYSVHYRGMGPKLNPPPVPLYTLPGLERPVPIPPWHLERLERLAEFTLAATKPEGHVIQIGDNDSGRFLKPQPALTRTTVRDARARYRNLETYRGLPDHEEILLENSLDHSHLVNAIHGLFGKLKSGKCHSLDADLALNLAGCQTLRSTSKHQQLSPAEVLRVGTRKTWEEWMAFWENRDESQRHQYEFASSQGSLRAGLVLQGFPNFGLYVFRSPRLYLAVRCGSVGQNGNGGHAHNDQLGIELQINGENRIVDPGSYLYTPLPEQRNRYRSVQAHFCPRVADREPNPLGDALFSMPDQAKPQCLYFGEEGFIGTHQGYGHPVYRIIKVDHAAVTVYDVIDGPETLVPLDPETFNATLPFSPGYGIQLTTPSSRQH